MIVTIPVWLIWTIGLLIGLPIVVVIFVLAYIGFLFVCSWSGLK